MENEIYFQHENMKQKDDELYLVGSEKVEAIRLLIVIYLKYVSMYVCFPKLVTNATTYVCT